MSGRDWFVVGVRLIGVWVLYTALGYFAAYADIRMAQATGHQPVVPNGGYEGGYLLQGAFFGAFSVYLILGTEHLASLCYGPVRSHKKAVMEELDTLEERPRSDA